MLNEALITVDGKNLCANRFSYLNSTGLSATQVFDETLATLFNAPGGGALYIENLKGAAGEIALRVGDNEWFGVINVGDDTKMLKLCEEKGLQAGHTRGLVPVEAVDVVVPIKPARCQHCQHPLQGEDPQPQRRQETEIPPVKPVVTAYQVHRLVCPVCGEATRADLPRGHPHRRIRSTRAGAAPGLPG